MTLPAKQFAVRLLKLRLYFNREIIIKFDIDGVGLNDLGGSWVWRLGALTTTCPWSPGNGCFGGF
jgi:hypothetical protein